MGRRSRGTGPRLLYGVGIGGTLVVLFVATLAIGSPTSSAWAPSGPSWSNGIVQCAFNESDPTAGISSASGEDPGLVVTLTSVAEVSYAGGGTVGSSSPISWTRVNSSGESGFDMAYSASASVVSPSAPGTALGSTELAVDYRLATPSTGSAAAMDAVTLEIRVSNWTWLAPGDGLALTLSLWPASEPAEHLTRAQAPGASVANIADSDGQTQEYLSLSATARVANLSGPTAPARVTPSVAIAPGRAQVVLAVDPGAGAYRTLDYVATIAVASPTPLAGVPIYDYALVAAAAGGVVLVLGVVARGLRRRPSDLIYADEEP